MSVYGVILFICEVLDKILNLSLIGLFVFEGILAVKSRLYLGKLRKQINQLNNQKGRKGKSLRRSKKEIQTHYEDPVKKWSDLEDFLNEYQEKMKTYTAFTLIIQLFTLLGILGTVAGLFVAMQDMEAVENLFEGVKFALSSTVLGIIFAVLYKVIDSNFPQHFRSQAFEK